jgi:hypothetical protein
MNKMKYLYAYEKFSAAVYQLATGPGDSRKRLWFAYLEFNPIGTEHLPEDLQQTV